MRILPLVLKREFELARRCHVTERKVGDPNKCVITWLQLVDNQRAISSQEVR
jgi:hypothetical protein